MHRVGSRSRIALRTSHLLGRRPLLHTAATREIVSRPGIGEIDVDPLESIKEAPRSVSLL